MVSCPLLSTVLLDMSMVGSGATVLIRKFGSFVGDAVEVGARGVDVDETESVIGWERTGAVCVQEIG